MTKSAYLVVTDLHLDIEKANRINYFAELTRAMTDILAIAGKYRSEDYSVKLLLLGDIFDGSIANPSDAMQLLEIFRYFCSNFDGVWSVVGNHELTYAKDNPFWFLVDSIEDAELSKVKRYISPRSLSGVIKVCDKLSEGNVDFYFNHYSILSRTPPVSDRINIGLFHQNVGSNDICKMWGTFDDVEEAQYIQMYNYCFFGHMHLAKGKYYLNEAETCLCEWLGTIGRTKITEVSNEDLKVNIPAICIQNGTFKGVEDNPILLTREEDTIDLSKLKAAECSKQIALEQQQTATTSYKGDTLYDTLKLSLAGGQLDFLFGFLDHSWDEVKYSYRQTLDNVLVEDGSEVTE